MYYYFHSLLIISISTLIIAAQCIQPKNSSQFQKAKHLKVLLGAYNISDAEIFREDFQVSGVLVHSGWNSNEFRYSNDVALLKLRTTIKEFFVKTNPIGPICLQNFKSISSIRKGTVTGYGKYNKTAITSDVPLKVKLTFIRQEIIEQKPDAVGPGDIGSGLYVEVDGKYYLRGIISTTFEKKGYNFAQGNFAFYTDVLKYLDDFILPVSTLNADLIS